MDSIPSMATPVPAPAKTMLDTTYAANPFDHPKADVILRSSDNVYFRVFKLFLSLASPFFETLFEIPQSTEGSEGQEVKDGLPVIPMTEDNKTLNTLLRFCYPCTLADDPKFEVLKDAVNVLEAAKKYSLDAIERRVRQAISTPQILKAEPLRCFAIARRGCLWQETRLAAKYTLTQPLIPSWFEEIELITATDLLVLLTYHKACGDAVYALKENLAWVKDHYKSGQGCAWLSGLYPDGTNRSTISYRNCQCPRAPVPRYTVFVASLTWWEDFMEETFTALRDKPCRSTAESFVEKTVQHVRAANCPTCSAHVPEGMHGFLELLVQKMEEEISKITLRFHTDQPRGGPKSSQRS